MDTPSHFFNDCVDFEDPNPYQSPEQDVGDGGGGGGMLAFQSYNGKLVGINDSPTSVDKALVSRMGAWDGFAEQMENLGAADQKPMFVDPGLYEGASENDEIKAQIQVLSMGMSRPSTRRTSSSKSGSQRTSKSSSTSTDVTPPDQGPPKKRKTRKTRKEPDMPEDDRKRSKFLERNRVAASKCREKKKQYVSDLEETKIGLETQHAHLQMEYNGLLGEVSGLKHHLMAHAKCNDPNIDRWLNNEARRFVQTSNELFGQSFNFNTPSSQTGMSTSSPRSSRNPSIASAYQALQGVQFDGLGSGSGERQGSISYSHGQSLYPSPADSAFPCLSSPHPKREPNINYDHMPDAMFSPEQSSFGGG